jgi:hypothetical protein
MATTVAAVRTFLGVNPASATDEAALTAAVDAANAWVMRVRPDWTTDDAGASLAQWPADADQAATMQAAHDYGRRSSTAGVAAFADVGVTFIPRMDPDVRRLLQLGEYQPPVVA